MGLNETSILTLSLRNSSLFVKDWLFLAGRVSADFYWYVPGLLVVAFIGSYGGMLALGKIDQKYFRRVVLALIFLIGLTTLGRFVQQIVR